MKFTQNQFKIFKKICKKYNIGIDTISINHLKLPSSKRFTSLRTLLKRYSDSIICKLLYNQLHHNTFWYNRERYKRAKIRCRIRKELRCLVEEINNNELIKQNSEKLAETEKWVKENQSAPAVDLMDENDEDHLIEYDPVDSNSGDAASVKVEPIDPPNIEDNEDLFELIADSPEQETVSKSGTVSEVAGNEDDQTDATIVDRLLYKLKPDEKQGDTLKEKIKIEETPKEVVKFNTPKNPNQLPTPIVENTRKASAFLTEENEDEFKEKEKLAKIMKMSTRMRSDDGKMMAKSEPPMLTFPERPSNMERARTVAEKRLLLSQKNDLRYHMIEQESKIYHQIQKKAKHNQINYSLLNCLLVTNVPIKKDPWRALTWLRTTEGNFIYKYAKVDDYELKMNGSVGNHRQKYIEPQTSKPLPKFRIVNRTGRQCCKPIRISDRLKRSLVRNKKLQDILLSDEIVDISDIGINPSRLNLEKKLAKVSPRPLCQKLNYINTHNMEAAGREANDEDIFLGEYQNYEMPKVYLEVNLQPNKPVDSEVKRYLKAILPHKSLDENWIEFALSTLKSNRKSLIKDQKTEQPNLFRFNIPYENDKDKIVVRKIIKKNVDKDPLRIPPSDPNKQEESEDEMEWSFDKDADKDNELDNEIVEIIKDLTNSTFVNLNDNLFTRDDAEDTSEERSMTPKFNILAQGNKKSDANVSPQAKKQARLMHELRRLNCNIVRAEDENSLSNDSRCTNEFCLKGCVCDSNSDKFSVNMEEARSSFSMEEMESLHKRATAKMAKEEKDFRSTIILTDTNSLLVRTNETEKRRLKRAPKKYSDYLVPDDALDIQVSRKRETSPVASTSTSSVKKKGQIKFTIHNIEKSEEEEEEIKDQPVAKKLFTRSNIMEMKKNLKPKVNNSNIINKQQHWRDDARMEKEIDKMLHVNVTLRKLNNFYDIEPWCMVHHLYKCMCDLKATQGHPLEYNDFMHGGEEKSSKTAHRKRKSDTNDHDSSPKKKPEEAPLVIDDVGGLQIQNIISLNPLQEDDDKSSRCAPVNTPFYKTKNQNAPLDNEKRGVLFRDFHGERRIEILNIDELLSEKKGPIYINIYDCRLNRLNDVMRRLILNDNAIIYIDGTSFYVDKSSGVDISKIDFDSVYDNIEHPIFILQKKGDGNAIEDGDQLPREFIKLMHDENSVIQEKNKNVLKEIGLIIDNVLKNVRKKMEKKVSTGPNGFHDGYVKEQLEKISRKRTTSCSSLSSASSPFYLDTPAEQQIRAQQIGPAQEFNNLFTARMRKFLDILRSNTLGLEPSDQLTNKFYLYRWDIFLRSFAQGLSEVWLATMQNEEGTPHFMMALTKKDIPPNIENVLPQNIQNIRKLQPLNPKYPEFVKIILLRVQNIMTKHMVVLLFGCKDYFRICGTLNTPVDYKACGFVARPNPRSHPELAKKIINVYKIWKSVKESNPAASNLSISMPGSSPNAVQNNNVARKYNNFRNESPVSSTGRIVINPLHKFKQIQSQQNQHQQQHPQAEKLYIAVRMTNDFSDLYIKGWNKYLSYNVIMRTLAKAKHHTGCLLMKPSSDDSCKVTAYAIGKKLDCLRKSKVQETQHDLLLFGPYDKKMDNELTLMQNVDGKLMTREFYEYKNKIMRRVKTTVDWIPIDPMKLKKETTSTNTSNPNNSAPHTQTSQSLNNSATRTSNEFVSLHSLTNSNSNSNPNKIQIKVAPFAKLMSSTTTSSASSSGTSTPTSGMGLKISSIVGNYQEYQNDQTDTVRKLQISNVSRAATLTNGGKSTDGSLNKGLNKYQNQPWTSIPEDYLDPDVIKSEPESDDDLEMMEA